MTNLILFIFFVAFGYFSGSICSAIIVSKLFGLPDPRTEGSQNPGATNVLRLAGKKYAIIVLITDMLKGLIPVFLTHIVHAGIPIASFTCLAAVVGHVFPVFFNFKGGKGVATALGGLLGLHFMLGVLVIATWLLVANYSRYSSLSSICAISLAPIFSIVSFDGLRAFFPLLCIALLILYQHRGNINRLMTGEEPKINFQKINLDTISEKIIREKNDDQDK